MRNKAFIQRTIALRIKDNDILREYAIRNKASPIDDWSNFKRYKKESIEEVFKPSVDGVKLKFKHTTLVINGRF